MKKTQVTILLAAITLFTALSSCAKDQKVSTEITDNVTKPSIATVTETQVENDWSVELLSTTCDGENARILFRVTAPNDVNLEEANKDYRSPYDIIDCIIPGNTLGMTWNGQHMFGTSMGIHSAEHNLIWSYGDGWEQDNDGLPNTLNYYVKIRGDKADPNKPLVLDNLFNTTTFYILFDDFVHAWYDEDVQKAIDEKYAGQDYMIDGEEMEDLYKSEILVDQEWKFTVNFDVE